MTLPPIAPRKPQCATVLDQARANRSTGIFSLNLRREHNIGNPSQRIADLEALGHKFRKERERAASGTWGTRWWLLTDAGGDGSVPRTKPAGERSPVSAERVLVGNAETGQLFELPSSDPLTGNAYRDAA